MNRPVRQQFYMKPVLKTKKKASRKVGFPKICDAEGCKVKVIWLLTRNEKWMKVEYDSVPSFDKEEIASGGNVFYDVMKHTTHFGRCAGYFDGKK